jgi:pimeloyl-ACP methyl ester carboxylesterase
MDYVEDLEALIGRLHLDRPVYVGHSMGARVGWFLAQSQPLRGLVIGDIGMDAQPNAWRQAEALDKMVEEEPEYFLGRDWKFSRHAIVETVRYGRAKDWIGLAATIECPVLFIRGGLSREVTRAEADRVCTHIRQCRLVEIPGAGHQLHESHPRAFAQAVIDYLTTDIK